MRLPGTQVQSSPASDVALRSAALVRPRPAPESPGQAVVQTAVVGAGLALATGVIAAQSPYVAHPTLQGVRVSGGDRRHHHGRVRRSAPGHRAAAAAGPLHPPALLGDDPRHADGAGPRRPRPDRMGVVARRRGVSAALVPGGTAPGRRRTRRRGADRDGIGPGLGRAAGHRRPPARVHAQGDLRERMPAQPAQDRGRRRGTDRRAGRGHVVADRRRAHRRRGGPDPPSATGDQHRAPNDGPDPDVGAGRGRDLHRRRVLPRERRGQRHARAARLGLDGDRAAGALRIPRGHAGRTGLRRRRARAAGGPSQRRRGRRQHPPGPRRRARRPIAGRRVLAAPAQRVCRRRRPSGPAAGTHRGQVDHRRPAGRRPARDDRPRRCPRHRAGPRRRCGRSRADDARERSPRGRSAGVRRGSGARRAPGWPRPRTPGGGRSSETSTTAPNSAWSRCG